MTLLFWSKYLFLLMLLLVVFGFLLVHYFEEKSK